MNVFRKAFSLGSGALALLFWAEPAVAQLAITEAMSRTTSTQGTTIVVPGPDYWELSNFGATSIDLTGFRFNDGDGTLLGADPNPFINLTIKAGESIVFFESVGNSLSIEAFRACWGLNPSVKVIAYTNDGFGLSSDAFGDGIRLWGPWASNEKDVVDSVEFGSATRGQSFTYSPSTGEFGIVSSLGLYASFKAVTSDDVGSPGTNTGPVRLSFSAQPTNLVVNPGDTATFAVRFGGLPRPTFQWFRNGQPIAGARFPSFTLESTQPIDAGTYHVTLSNIFEVVTSATATLSVNTQPSAPIFLQTAAELRVFVDQNATLRSAATGVPQPNYQWHRNGILLPNATNRTLFLPAWHLPGTNTYSVVAANSMGSVSNQALLIASERPDLRITEVMPSERQAPGFGHQDWWELTNFGTDPVDLFGYRFDDFSDVIGQAQRPRLELAWTLTNHVVIKPGESIIFVEAMSPEAFRRWWGFENLPRDLQIVTYSGAGRGLSGERADGLGLWNMGSTLNDDVVNEFTLVSYSEFSISNGVSFTVVPEDPIDQYCCELLSEVGVRGAFVAVEAGDIGSPGYIRTPTDLTILKINYSSAGCQLTWRSALPGNYVLQYRDLLGEGTWLNLVTVEQAGPISSYLDVSAREASQRFYRVIDTP